MNGELLAALLCVIDARLTEHGLLEVAPAPPKGKGKPAGKAKAAEAEEETIDFDSLKAKITEVMNSKGKDEAKAILKKFKVEKLSDLPEAKFGKLNEALDAALGAEEDGGDLFGD